MEWCFPRPHLLAGCWCGKLFLVLWQVTLSRMTPSSMSADWEDNRVRLENEVTAFYNSNTGMASPHHGHIHWVRKLLMRKELTKTSISEVRSHHHHDGAYVIKWLWKLNTIMNVKFQAWDLANSRHSTEVIHIFLLSWYRSHSWPKIYISKNSLLQGSQASLLDMLIKL